MRSLCRQVDAPHAAEPDRFGLLRKGDPIRDPESAKQQEPGAEDDVAGRRVIVCSYCAHRITTTATRTRVDGKHEHVRSNPDGFLFHIACYASAPGCAPQGPASAYWTWFPGYSWQVALCRGCRAHLGWSFRGSNGGFHGLIVNRITEAEEEQAD